MHQTLGIVMLVLSVFGLVVIGLFCLSVIVEILEERSKMRTGGGEATPLDGMNDKELLNHVRKSDSCCYEVSGHGREENKE